jgi:hypothetical protein
MQQTVAAVIGMKTHRKVYPFDGGGHVYGYPPTVESATHCQLGNLDVEIRTDGNFFRTNFSSESFENKHMLIRMVCMSSMVYLHHQLAEVCREAFGIHAQYFLMNYIMRIPEHYVRRCAELTDKIPRMIRLFGIHLRYHWAGSFFCRGIPEALSVVLPFCFAQREHRPTTFVLATDNEELFRALEKVIKPVSAPIRRASDGPDDAGLTDIVMLMMCEEWLLTWRSTYSLLVSLRMGRRVWMIEKYSKEVFLISHSQVSYAQTPLYLGMPDWKPFELSAIADIGAPGQLEAMRFFYRWLVL